MGTHRIGKDAFVAALGEQLLGCAKGAVARTGGALASGGAVDVRAWLKEAHVAVDSLRGDEGMARDARRERLRELVEIGLVLAALNEIGAPFE